jgi:hypothetical protein
MCLLNATVCSSPSGFLFVSRTTPAYCQGLVPRTNTMVADIVKSKRSKGKAGKGAAAAGGGGEGDELAGEGLAGDAEGGAALAEEAGLPGDVQVGVRNRADAVVSARMC